MLRFCGSKYQQLLSTPEGAKSFHSAVIDLIGLIEGVINKSKRTIVFFLIFILSNTTAISVSSGNQVEGINMMIEVVVPLQAQGEFTSR